MTRHEKNTPRITRMQNRPSQIQKPNTAMKNIRSLFLLPLLSAVLVTSCVVPRGPRHSPVLAGGFRVYSALPRDYVGGAYFLGGRYYSGGRYETGAFHDHGHAYHDRYFYSGRYYYGGRFENHGSPGHQQSAGRVVIRDSRDNRDHGDHGMNRGPANPGPMNRGSQPGPGPGPSRPF